MPESRLAYNIELKERQDMTISTPKKKHTISEENHYVVVKDGMEELDVDIFLAVRTETEKSDPNQERLKKLESLRAELLRELKTMSIDQLELIKQSEKLYSKILKEFNQAL